MKKISAALFIFLLSFSALALPPTVEVDRLLLQAKSALDTKDYAQATESLTKAEKLGVKLPDTFYYHYSRAYAGTGKLELGLDMLERYLSLSGSNGKFYQEALVEMNNIEAAIKKRDAEKDAERKRYKAQLAEYQKSVDDCPDIYQRAVDQANNMFRKYTKACEGDNEHASCEYIQRMIDRNGPQYNDKRIDRLKYWARELEDLQRSSSYEYCLDRYTKPEMPAALR
jgi:hypothetical protein